MGGKQAVQFRAPNIEKADVRVFTSRDYQPLSNLQISLPIHAISNGFVVTSIPVSGGSVPIAAFSSLAATSINSGFGFAGRLMEHAFEARQTEVHCLPLPSSELDANLSARLTWKAID